MQVCSPQDIRQAHSQNPPNSRVSLEKPLSLTWLRTIFLEYHRVITIRLWTFRDICLSTMCPVVHALIQINLYLLQREFKPIVLAKLHLKQPAHSSLRLFPTRKIHIWNVAFIPIVWWTELKWKRKKRTPSMSSAALSELVTKTGL